MHGSFGPFPEVQGYVHDLQSARCSAAIAELLSCATRTIGFDHFALTRRAVRANVAQPAPISDYPTQWVQVLSATGHVQHDPIEEASRKRITPFHWGELPEIIALTPDHQGFLALAASKGLEQGWTVPLHVPGESSGACSFVLTRPVDLPRHNLPAAQYLASFAFEAARRVTVQHLPAARLTKRQVECTILAARGKSDWVAAQLLGLAPDTVHKYLEQAKARFGVSSRTELVVRALYDGQISFSDLLD